MTEAELKEIESRSDSAKPEDIRALIAEVRRLQPKKQNPWGWTDEQMENAKNNPDVHLPGSDF